DLSTATGEPVEVISGDVLELARQLGDRGLLDGVTAPLPENHVDWTPPEPLEVGATVEEFTLADLEGTPTALSSLLDRPLLLVNWSAGCGFCVKIAEELGALQKGLDEHGVGLAFVTAGDVDANRKVFDEAGID